MVSRFRRRVRRGLSRARSAVKRFVRRRRSRRPVRTIRRKGIGTTRYYASRRPSSRRPAARYSRTLGARASVRRRATRRASGSRPRTSRVNRAQAAIERQILPTARNRPPVARRRNIRRTIRRAQPSRNNRASAAQRQRERIIRPISSRRVTPRRSVSRRRVSSFGSRRMAVNTRRPKARIRSSATVRGRRALQTPGLSYQRRNRSLSSLRFGSRRLPIRTGNRRTAVASRKLRNRISAAHRIRQARLRNPSRRSARHRRNLRQIRTMPMRKPAPVIPGTTAAAITPSIPTGSPPSSGISGPPWPQQQAGGDWLAELIEQIIQAIIAAITGGSI